MSLLQYDLLVFLKQGEVKTWVDDWGRVDQSCLQMKTVFLTMGFGKLEVGVLVKIVSVHLLELKKFMN